MAKQTSTKRSTTSTAGKASPKSNSGNNKPGGENSSQRHPMLEKFFIDELKDIYWAEKHLVKALKKLKKAATTDELQQAFEDHTAATEEHVNRLEQVFQMFGKKPQAKKCEAMDGLTKEADGVIEDTENGSMTRDVGLIISAQKVEHYEIATYGSLVQLANTMNLPEIAEILEETLQEEKDTDELLSYIAENDINMEAEMEREEV
ncbi:MAG TPA: ferritin-like domain-containing protein [Chitinophagaceae bacterium]|nr:ferritin-like domain-containing protein [Chitinophagaceae bacterium]